jgi:hypothetical protein
MTGVRDDEAGYVREVRTERWLNLTVAAWLAALALLAAGWLIAAAFLRTGLHLLDLVRPLP